MPKKDYKQTKEHIECRLNSRLKNDEWWKNPEKTKQKIRETLNGCFLTKECKEKIRQSTIKRFQDPKEREKISLKLKGRQNNKGKSWTQSEEAKEKRRGKPSSAKGKHWKLSRVTKKKHSKSMKSKWQDPEYNTNQLEAILKASDISPNKTEIFLTDFFNNVLLNKINFVGDGQFFLGGKCPDFRFIDGQKKLIEYNSEYWHSKCITGEEKREHEQRRINHFKQFGYSTLIIWEPELQNLKKLKERIQNFNRRV